MPLAMPGPKIERPSSDSAASAIAMTWLMSGATPRLALVNWLKSVVPMPVMTARTSTLMPVETTWPKTFSAMNAVLLKKAKGSSTKPASVTSLNSISVMKTCTAMMKKASTTMTQASSNTRISARFEKTAQRLEN
ncbi:hypothetical protein SPH9361_02737 [Sphingobium sp. CECT 9361]|nr:hypothetical protein SPH9361_02737 [Sphingobium sp. CECT 9361]